MKTAFEYPLALAKTLLIQNRYLSYKTIFFGTS